MPSDHAAASYLQQLKRAKTLPAEVPMKAYVMTTGVLFGLLTAVHVWRFIDEGSPILRDPWYIGITVASTALCLWAIRLLRAPVRS
jgi:hypothetical protein